MMSRTTVVGVVTWGMVFAGAPAWADFRLDRRLALESGQTLTLLSDSGSVTLTGDSTSGGVLTVTAWRDDFNRRFDIQIEEHARGVTVAVKRRGGWLSSVFGDWLYPDHAQIAVRVPRRTVVDINSSGGGIQVSTVTGQVRLHTSGGSLRADEVDGDVSAHTSGGSVRVVHVRGDVVADTSGGGMDIADVRGSVRADTSGGGIRIDGVSGEVHARTSGGGVRVRGAGGRVEAQSSGGPVTVGFAAGNGHGGALSSSGGGVHTELDPTVAVSIDAASSGGGVSSELSVMNRGHTSNRSLRGDINGGGPILQLRSSGGGIRISAGSRGDAR